jgi:hypothetical protein
MILTFSIFGHFVFIVGVAVIFGNVWHRNLTAADGLFAAFRLIVYRALHNERGELIQKGFIYIWKPLFGCQLCTSGWTAFAIMLFDSGSMLLACCAAVCAIFFASKEL